MSLNYLNFREKKETKGRREIQAFQEQLGLQDPGVLQGKMDPKATL